MWPPVWWPVWNTALLHSAGRTRPDRLCVVDHCSSLSTPCQIGISNTSSFPISNISHCKSSISLIHTMPCSYHLVNLLLQLVGTKLEAKGVACGFDLSSQQNHTLLGWVGFLSHLFKWVICTGCHGYEWLFSLFYVICCLVIGIVLKCNWFWVTVKGY